MKEDEHCEGYEYNENYEHFEHYYEQYYHFEHCNNHEHYQHYEQYEYFKQFFLSFQGSYILSPSYFRRLNCGRKCSFWECGLVNGK